MYDQMTAARERDGGGTRDDLSRTRLGLMVGLPLYAAVTMAAVTVALLALPVHLYLLSNDLGSSDGAGLGLVFFIAWLVNSAFVPGAVALALGMRAILNRMLRNGAELAGRERDEISVVGGFAILHTALLAWIFMRHIRPVNLLWSVLLAAVAVAGILGLHVLLVLPFFDSDAGAIGYLAILTFFALLLYAVAAAPVWRMMFRTDDKRLSAVVLIAAAIGLAAGALTILLPYFLLGLPSAELGFFGLYVVLVFVMPIVYVLTFLFILPLLLRASAAYVRLRRLESEGRLAGGASITAALASIAALATLLPVLLLAAVLLLPGFSDDPSFGALIIIQMTLPAAAAGALTLLRAPGRRMAEWLTAFALLSSMPLPAIVAFNFLDSAAAWQIAAVAAVYSLALISVWLLPLLLAWRGGVELKLPGVRVLLSAAGLLAGIGVVLLTAAITIELGFEADELLENFVGSLIAAAAVQLLALLLALLLHGLLRVRPIRRRAARLKGLLRNAGGSAP